MNIRHAILPLACLCCGCTLGTGNVSADDVVLRSSASGNQAHVSSPDSAQNDEAIRGGLERIGEPTGRELRLDVSPRMLTTTGVIRVSGETTHPGPVSIGLRGPHRSAKPGDPDAPRLEVQKVDVVEGRYEATIRLADVGDFVQPGEFSFYSKVGNIEVAELVLIAD